MVIAFEATDSTRYKGIVVVVVVVVVDVDVVVVTRSR